MSSVNIGSGSLFFFGLESGKILSMSFAMGRACLFGPARYGVCAILGCTPFVICALGSCFQRITRFFHARRTRTLMVLCRVLRVALALVFGVGIGIWMQFAPCVVMICDGGYYDNPTLRYMLQVVTAPLCAAMLYECMSVRKSGVIVGRKIGTAVSGVPIASVV